MSNMYWNGGNNTKAGGAMKNILVVEHNDYFREKIAGVLSRFDFVGAVAQVARFRNLFGALEDMHVNLILMNIEIASFDFDCIKSIKEKHPGIRIVVYTDNARSECERAAIDAGADRFIPQDSITSELEEFLV